MNRIESAGRGAEVGHEGRRHDPLADHRLVEPGLDQHRVDDREARRRERDARRSRPGVAGPAERRVGERHTTKNGATKETPDRRADARHSRLNCGTSTSAPARNVSTMPGERAEEREPVGNVEVERVADDDAQRELDQRDRDPELDRDRRGDQDRRPPESPQLRVRSPLPPATAHDCGRGHQPRRAVRREPHRACSPPTITGAVAAEIVAGLS